MKIKKILNLFIVFTLISTQTILSANEVKYKLEYFYVKNNENIKINETTTNTINYSSILDDLNNRLFSMNDSNGQGVLLAITNNEVKKHMEQMKTTDFVLKGTDSLIKHNDSAFGKTFELDYNDEDGIYIGFIENHLSSVSRGYYMKKYTKFDKIDGVQKEYIYFGKANFLEDLSSNLVNYMNNNKVDNIQPLLLSYYNYLSTYSNFSAPGKGASENSEGIYRNNNFGWNGLINLNQKNNSYSSVYNKLNSLSLPYSSVQGQSLSSLTNGSNKLFIENGKVFQYKPSNGAEELVAHMSLSNAFMANNNIKRGFLFKPSNPYNNFKFKSHQRCVKRVLKSCIKYEFWQTVTYKDGLDVYTSNFLDENFMDDWTLIPYQNADFMTGSVILPTMIPVNSYAKLPSLNSENYGFLYLSNYSGSLGGHGKYGYNLFSIGGVKGGKKVIESSRISKWNLAKIISVVVGLVFGAPAGIILYQFIRKSFSNNAFNKTINQDYSNINAVANNIVTQYTSDEEREEILNSPIMFGLMSNYSNFDMNKNFLSSSFHSQAIAHAKNDINIRQDYFFKQIPIIEVMQKSSQFWKQQHINNIISSYRDNFYNDGRNGGQFYSMQTIVRDVVRQYTGY